VGEGSISGRFEVTEGDRAVFALSFSHQEPLVIPARQEVEARLAGTKAFWRHWSDGLRRVPAWSDAVIRSALALKLLVHAPSGAIAAAGTTSLPEVLGGERNWDYRYCWVRDSAFVLGALLRLGCTAEADAFFWWLMQASQLTHPRLRVLYRLDGGVEVDERSLQLVGYRGSAPVRVGNGAATQVQLDVYGDLFQAAWLYAQAGRPIDSDIGRRLAETADLICRIWSEPDAGIWEVRSDPAQFTQSKMMCWIALDRAIRLAEQGIVPAKRVGRWRRERDAAAEFVERRCWSEEKRSYVRCAGSEELDASLLLGVLLEYGGGDGRRLAATVEAIRRELATGPFVRRYSGDDGLSGKEGAFLTCSFWLAEALARSGRSAEAVELMEELLGLSNDVGLYAEEIDPGSGDFLGNVPQGLSHLALISAAAAIARDGGG
jgi:GH15 family glucan-1,4-alpha-glucosidase